MHAEHAVARDVAERVQLARMRVVLVFGVLVGRLVARKLLVEREERILVLVELDAARLHELGGYVQGVRARYRGKRHALVDLLPEGDLLLAGVRVRQLAGAFAQLLGGDVLDGGAALFEQHAQHLIGALLGILGCETRPHVTHARVDAVRQLGERPDFLARLTRGVDERLHQLHPRMRGSGHELGLLVPAGARQRDRCVFDGVGLLEVEAHEAFDVARFHGVAQPVGHVVLFERIAPAHDERLVAVLGEGGAHGVGAAVHGVVERRGALRHARRIEPAAGRETCLVLADVR